MNLLESFIKLIVESSPAEKFARLKQLADHPATPENERKAALDGMERLKLKYGDEAVVYTPPRAQQQKRSTERRTTRSQQRRHHVVPDEKFARKYSTLSPEEEWRAKNLAVVNAYFKWSNLYLEKFDNVHQFAEEYYNRKNELIKQLKKFRKNMGYDFWTDAKQEKVFSDHEKLFWHATMNDTWSKK